MENTSSLTHRLNGYRAELKAVYENVKIATDFYHSHFPEDVQKNITFFSTYSSSDMIKAYYEYLIKLDQITTISDAIHLNVAELTEIADLEMDESVLKACDEILTNYNTWQHELFQFVLEHEVFFANKDDRLPLLKMYRSSSQLLVRAQILFL